MNKGRIEAFSDGVIAIVITLMAFQIKTPIAPTLAAFAADGPVLFSYLLSFVFLGIYWSNHHHLFQAVRQIDGRTLWANLHLLFWLSLVPFTSDWIGQSHFAAQPVRIYGVVMLMAGVAYTILTKVLVRCQGPQSTLARAVGGDPKGLLSVGAYLTAVLVAGAVPALAMALYVLVALMWLIPDRRIERLINADPPA